MLALELVWEHVLSQAGSYVQLPLSYSTVGRAGNAKAREMRGYESSTQN